VYISAFAGHRVCMCIGVYRDLPGVQENVWNGVEARDGRVGIVASRRNALPDGRVGVRARAGLSWRPLTVASG